jgi:hypothetical protein
MINLIWTFFIEVFGKQALVNFFKRNKTIAFLCFTNTTLLVMFLYMLEQAKLHERNAVAVANRLDVAGVALENYETVRMNLKNCQADVENQHEAVRRLGAAYSLCLENSGKQPPRPPRPRGRDPAVINRHPTHDETLRRKLDAVR